MDADIRVRLTNLGFWEILMFSSKGILRYGPGIRLIISIDSEIVNYYRSLIPKHYYVSPQKYSAHVTIVRTGKEHPPKMEAWGKHEGSIIPFDYDPEIHCDGPYWYLNATSTKIGEIRQELGLPEFRFSDRQCYHISLGNTKTL